MKTLNELSNEDIERLFGIGANWHAYKIRIEYGTIHIKWRRAYTFSDIRYNDDGYEYKTTFIHPENLSLREVKMLNENGYSTPYNDLKPLI